MFNWVWEYVSEIQDAISSDFDAYDVSGYLADQLTEAAQIVAYNDAWTIVEWLGNGDFLSDDDQALLRDQKIKMMLDILEDPNHVKQKEMQQIIGNMQADLTTCPVFCTIF